MKGTEEYTVALDSETDMHCTLQAYTNVENAAEIRKKLMNGELRCCVAKLSLITDPFQAVVAANKAAINARLGQLTTKTIYTEVLFCLSTSRNISRSLVEFGIGDTDTDILVILIHERGELKSVEESIKGTRVAVSRVPEFTNLELVRKAYKIDKDELSVSSYCDSVVSKISSKDFTSLK